MSEGTIWLIWGIGGVIAAVLLLAVIENAVRAKRPRKTFAETFDIDPATMRETHTSFGNPLGHGDIEKANAYMRDKARETRRAQDKEQGK